MDGIAPGGTDGVAMLIALQARAAIRKAKLAADALVSTGPDGAYVVRPAFAKALHTAVDSAHMLLEVPLFPEAASATALPSSSTGEKGDVNGYNAPAPVDGVGGDHYAMSHQPRHFAAEQHERVMRALQAFVAMQVERSTRRRSIQHLQRSIELLRHALDDAVTSGAQSADAETDVAEALASLLAYAEASDIDVFAMLNLVAWRTRKGECLGK